MSNSVGGTAAKHQISSGRPFLLPGRDYVHPSAIGITLCSYIWRQTRIPLHLDRLIEISDKNDIPPDYFGTPIGDLLEYHNLDRELDTYDAPRLLIGMCMDNRKDLRLPKNFAFIIRDGGARIRDKKFKVSFAISVGGIKHIAIIGHSQCGMVGLESKKKQFIEGLVSNAGWDRASASEHFAQKSPMYEIVDAIGFTVSEVKRLREEYPKITIAPLYYRVEDDRLYFIEE